VQLAPHKQLLIVDTNIALHQIDVLEYNCPATSLVIVLQTVLQELRHLNLAAYKRVLELLKDQTKTFIFYPNEMSAQTNINRSTGETINDANDRAIREAAQYFHHMIEDAGEVILLSNDKDNQVGDDSVNTTEACSYN
jgi:exosome complex exonuclease DIS3/RRP44